MAQLLVRKLDEKLVKRLKRRAAEHGVSMEEEHRRILLAALPTPAPKPKMSLLEYLATMPNVGDDSVFERRREYPRDIDLR
jgi:plasmid stability protein